MRSLPFQGGNDITPLSELPDGALLLRYVQSADGGAFAALYERHKQMVLAVCKYILHHRQDAEGASQETFLVLMQKAAEIDTGEPIQGWLHGAAELITGHIRRSRTRRQAHEEDYKESQQIAQIAQPIDEAERHEEQVIVNEALKRLPEKYRLLLLKQYYEEKSRGETAQELGLPEGTVATRLKKGREMLWQQLECRGVTPT